MQNREGNEKKSTNATARFAWARFTRRILLNEKNRKLRAAANFRRLATDLLVMHASKPLFLRTRFARMVNKYTRLKRNERHMQA